MPSPPRFRYAFDLLPSPDCCAERTATAREMHLYEGSKHAVLQHPDGCDSAGGSLIASMPEPKDQSVQGELQGVVTAIDQPQLEAATGKCVVDAEAGGDVREPDHEAGVQGDMEVRCGPEVERERDRCH